MLADTINQTIDTHLANYLVKSLDIQFESWIDPKTHLVVGQNCIFASGNITGTPGSLESAVIDGRNAALSVHKKFASC